MPSACSTWAERASRHDNASDYFQRLYEDDHLPDTLSKYRNNIADVLQQKADMQYKSVDLSSGDLEKLRKQVTRFIDNAVREHVDET